MKKLLVLLLAAVMVLSLAACTKKEDTKATDNTEDTQATDDTESKSEEAADGVMSYAEYMDAELDSEVTVVCYVQAHQSWWEDKVTVYAADKDGAYFIYELACSEEDAEKLVPGAKIRVSGRKAEWSGEVEITEATFEFVEDGEEFTTDAVDVTDLIGKDELIDYMNQFVSFKGMTVTAVSFKGDAPGDDIYVNAKKGDEEVAFCLEYYLNGSDQEFYDSVGALKEGDVIDIEGFLYWYNGANPHITKITKSAE